jgi:RNA recognition motif-containing protein
MKKFEKPILCCSTAAMSKHTKEDSPEEVEVPKKAERKEKKEKKTKKSKTEVAAPIATEDASDDATETPAKKRKREALPDEIEIDVGAPEPASKKEARRLKKAKLNPPTASGAATGANAATETDPNDKTAKRSDYGVWIGNLPWSATKEWLRNFLMEHTELTTEQITRVHLPPPTKPVNPAWTTKPLNKGFAYVDFSTELAMYTAIALTETKMDGRALLIKNAKSFEGRPDKPKEEQEQDTGRGGKGAARPTHPPNKRVFVGNLSFDVTKEDLEQHYLQCGPIENLHMATFEDSGKCKGYAWVTFGDVESATSAVKGFIFKTEAEIKKEKKAAAPKDDSSDSDADLPKANKKRKWLLNRLNGRELRCEFAEDSTTRYNKRYGKDKEAEPVDGVNPARWKNFEEGGGRGGGGRGRGGGGRGGRGGRGGFQSREPREKVDARTIPSGKAHSHAQRASTAIVESQGKKTKFE